MSDELRKKFDELKKKSQEEEREAYARMLASQLLYPFYKWEAESHGFFGSDAVPRYLKWKEEDDRRRNKFHGFYVGEWDQKYIQSLIASYRAQEWRGLDPIDSVLHEYGYGYADYRPNFTFHWNGLIKKWVSGSSGRRVSRDEVATYPEEERNFPSGNWSFDRAIVTAVLTRYGWTLGKQGWTKTGSKGGPVFWRNKPSKCMYCGAPESELIYETTHKDTARTRSAPPAVLPNIFDYYRCKRCGKLTPFP